MSIRPHGFAVSLMVVLTCGCATSTHVASAPAPRRSVLSGVAYVVGGLVVGSWAGYMMSQVAWSDWQQNPDLGSQRLQFTVVGGAMGMFAGALIWSQAPQGPTTTMPGLPLAPAGGPITADEIRASHARSVTELLRLLRPQWLRMRGQDVLGSTAEGQRVYLNGELLGGLSSLDHVSIDAVTRVEFVDAGDAVLRWGIGNEDGAILLSTQVPS
jgi:hypothetical protein